jgi:plastocyanin
MNYRIAHDPDTIPVIPILSQEQALAIVENEYRRNTPGYQEAYLHFQYYNYSKGIEQDEEYQRYLMSLNRGWKLSEIKAEPSLLSLSLFFVHANGTVYSISTENHTFEKVCDKPSIDCPLGRAGETARDRLVYEVGAIVEGSNGYHSDVHYIIDAETGQVVYNIPYFNPRPMPDRFIIVDNNTQTVRELAHRMENARFGASIEIQQNASKMDGGTVQQYRGYNPSEVTVRLLNITTDAVTIIWVNRDDASHTVTSDDGYSDILDNKLDSGLIRPGGEYTFVFIEEGPYQYHCRIHPWMKGSISVMPSDFS